MSRIPHAAVAQREGRADARRAVGLNEREHVAIEQLRDARDEHDKAEGDALLGVAHVSAEVQQVEDEARDAGIHDGHVDGSAALIGDGVVGGEEGEQRPGQGGEEEAQAGR